MKCVRGWLNDELAFLSENLSQNTFQFTLYKYATQKTLFSFEVLWNLLNHDLWNCVMATLPKLITFHSTKTFLWQLCLHSWPNPYFKIILIEWHCCWREVRWKCWRAKSRYNETLISQVPSQGLLQLSLKSREHLLLIIVELDQRCMTRWRLCESSLPSTLSNREVKNHNFSLKDILWLGLIFLYFLKQKIKVKCKMVCFPFCFSAGQ